MGFVLLVLIGLSVGALLGMNYCIKKWLKDVPSWIKALLLLSSPVLAYMFMNFLFLIDFL